MFQYAQTCHRNPEVLTIHAETNWKQIVLNFQNWTEYCYPCNIPVELHYLKVKTLWKFAFCSNVTEVGWLAQITGLLTLSEFVWTSTSTPTSILFLPTVYTVYFLAGTQNSWSKYLVGWKSPYSTKSPYDASFFLHSGRWFIMSTSRSRWWWCNRVKWWIMNFKTFCSILTRTVFRNPYQRKKWTNH